MVEFYRFVFSGKDTIAVIEKHLCLATLAVLVCSPHPALAKQDDESIVQNAAVVLRDAIVNPGVPIPATLLADAHGIAIIPDVIKGGFVVGARHGRGLLFIRDPDGTWHAPVFVSLTGGNVGWQAGLQSSDLVLVFKNPQSIQGILDGKLTLGADAGAAAGPLGMQAAAGTDGKMKAEIYTYSRSRGLFAGVSIDGSVIRIDRFATAAYYQSAGPGQPVVVPASAQQLTQAVVDFTSGSQPSVGGDLTAVGAASVTPHHAVTDDDVVRGQLVELAPQLYALLDAQWKSYLALPAPLYREDAHLSADELAPVLQRFETVVTNPQLSSLADRPEFQSVYGLLKHYEQSLQSASPALQLPPPPGTVSASSR